MVACTAALAEVADFLAAAVAFFAGGMTVSLGSRANLLARIGFEQSLNAAD